MDLIAKFLIRLETADTFKPALVQLNADGTKKTFSWGRYRRLAVRMAQALRKNGVARGDFVAIIPLNLPESFWALLGIILAEAIPVPLNVQLLKEPGQKELKQILADCQPKLILTNGSLYEYLDLQEYKNSRTITGMLVLEGGPLEYILFDYYCWLECEGWRLKIMPDGYNYLRRHLDDLLVMPYTSGTTGTPKGAMLSHRNILDRVEAMADELKVNENERVLSYLSLGHISDLIATFFGQAVLGYTVYFTEYAKYILDDRKKLKRNFASVLNKTRSTIFLAMPTVWMNLRAEIEKKLRYLPVPACVKSWLVKRQLGFLKTRIFINAGAMIQQEDLNFFSNLGIEITDIYGQTETAGPLTLNGRPIGKNTYVEPGPDGEITVYGDNVMIGYFSNPQANSDAFRSTMSLEGRTYNVFYTGDIGSWSSDGRVEYAGRIGNGFKLSQGEFITADQIEMLEKEIKKIPGVDEAIVCGDGRAYLLALVFTSNYGPGLYKSIGTQLRNIGKGLLRVRKFALLNSTKLEYTPTGKLKRGAMIKKYRELITHL